MFNGDLEFVKNRIEYIRFGMVKITGKPFLKQDRFLSEVIEMDNKGNLWVELKEELPKVLINSKGFSVSLQFVHKEEDMFLKAKGRAFIEEYSEHIEEDTQKPLERIFENKTRIVLRIELQSANYFRKKTLSRYTSMFQNVANLNLKKIFQGVKPE
jgi:general stress protein 26